MPLEEEQTKILNFAKRRVAETFGEGSRYYLSSLGPELIAAGLNYKDILQGQRLSDFIRSHPEELKLVTHPQQRTKIVVVPPNSDFDFVSTENAVPEAEPRRAAEQPRKRTGKNAYTVLNFLNLLLNLEKEEADLVDIPPYILAKLAKD